MVDEQKAPSLGEIVSELNGGNMADFARFVMEESDSADLFKKAYEWAEIKYTERLGPVPVEQARLGAYHHLGAYFADLKRAKTPMLLTLWEQYQLRNLQSPHS